MNTPEIVLHLILYFVLCFDVCATARKSVWHNTYNINERVGKWATTSRHASCLLFHSTVLLTHLQNNRIMCALSAVLTCLLVKALLSILNVFIAPVSILLKWLEAYFHFQREKCFPGNSNHLGVWCSNCLFVCEQRIIFWLDCLALCTLGSLTGCWHKLVLRDGI